MNSPTTPKVSALQLADRFFSAIERRAMNELRAIYAPDALIWHNFDPLPARFDRLQSQSVADNLAMLDVMPGLIVGMHYDVWNQVATDKGFVRQHIVRGRTAGGDEVAIPACVIVELEGGRITRLDEYIHVGHLPPAVIEYFARPH